MARSNAALRSPPAFPLPPRRRAPLSRTRPNCSAWWSITSGGAAAAPCPTPPAATSRWRASPSTTAGSTLEDLPPFKTTVTVDATRKIITRNNSPDIGFDRSINPYRGCEHGCVYCFARPTHAYLGLSPGPRFRIQAVREAGGAPNCWKRNCRRPNYEPRVIAIGTNTDPYQPIERRYQVMRRILEVLDRAGHPVGIVTKSALVLRDLDILARMAERNLAKVALSVTTLDAELARKMEPRAATPMRRLETLRRLSQAGVPTTVMVAPVIPALNDMRDRAHPRSRACRRRARRRATCCCGCRSRCATCSANGCTANYPDREQPRVQADPRHARRQGLRLRPGSSA